MSATMKIKQTLSLVLAAGLSLAGSAVAQLNISGGADLKAILALGQKQIDAGKEIPEEQRQQYEQFKGLVEAGLEKVSVAVGGTTTAPEVSVGLSGNKENIKGALTSPEGALAEIIKRDPAGGENDFILVADPAMAGPAAAAAGPIAAEGPKEIPVTMVEGDDAIYFGMRGQDSAQISAAGTAQSILPGEYDRIWHVQGGLPADLKTSIMGGIQQMMAASGEDNPAAGQMMMMMGMAMPVITDLSNTLKGVDTLALGFLVAPDDRIVLDVAQKHGDADTAATLGASLADGSYQPTGLAEVFHAFATAPGVETKHLSQGDVVFSRMMWAKESMPGIGEAVQAKGMEYFQKLMSGGGAGPGAVPAPAPRPVDSEIPKHRNTQTPKTGCGIRPLGFPNSGALGIWVLLRHLPQRLADEVHRRMGDAVGGEEADGERALLGGGIDGAEELVPGFHEEVDAGLGAADGLAGALHQAGEIALGLDAPVVDPTDVEGLREFVHHVEARESDPVRHPGC